MPAQGMERYRKIEKLGEGTYGVVYKGPSLSYSYASPNTPVLFTCLCWSTARDAHDGQIVALKRIALDSQAEVHHLSPTPAPHTYDALHLNAGLPGRPQQRRPRDQPAKGLAPPQHCSVRGLVHRPACARGPQPLTCNGAGRAQAV